MIGTVIGAAANIGSRLIANEQQKAAEERQNQYNIDAELRARKRALEDRDYNSAPSQLAQLMAAGMSKGMALSVINGGQSQLGSVASIPNQAIDRSDTIAGIGQSAVDAASNIAGQMQREQDMKIQAQHAEDLHNESLTNQDTQKFNLYVAKYDQAIKEAERGGYGQYIAPVNEHVNSKNWESFTDCYNNLDPDLKTQVNKSPALLNAMRAQIQLNLADHGSRSGNEASDLANDFNKATLEDRKNMLKKQLAGMDLDNARKEFENKRLPVLAKYMDQDHYQKLNLLSWQIMQAKQQYSLTGIELDRERELELLKTACEKSGLELKNVQNMYDEYMEANKYGVMRGPLGGPLGALSMILEPLKGIFSLVPK